MSTCAVSVIIPMYNAEKYIRQCLMSVLASTFKDYEVLVIDDCSSDNSVAEVENLLPYFDGRLKLLSTGKNSGGAGVPRNIGINNASGKYVTFVDNDDMIMPNTLEDFFNAAENFQADVVHSEQFIIFTDTDLQFAKPRIESGESSSKFVDKPTLEPDDLQERIKRYTAGKFFWLPWGKFYRREFLLENRIEFPQIQFSEDMVFCFKCLCLAKNYLRVPYVNNIHRMHDSSAARDFDLKMWLIVTTKVVSVFAQFMSGHEFFRRNAITYHAVLKFVIDKSFSWIKTLSDSKPHEVQKIFYNYLHSPDLDSRGKDIIAAYLYTERAMNQTR